MMASPDPDLAAVMTEFQVMIKIFCQIKIHQLSP
jgi:hypothetical protein